MILITVQLFLTEIKSNKNIRMIPLSYQKTCMFKTVEKLEKLIFIVYESVLRSLIKFIIELHIYLISNYPKLSVAPQG
jgi:hypothetical protein